MHKLTNMIDENQNVHILYEIGYQIKIYRTPKLTFKCYFQSYARNRLMWRKKHAQFFSDSLNIFDNKPKVNNHMNLL